MSEPKEVTLRHVVRVTYDDDSTTGTLGPQLELSEEETRAFLVAEISARRVGATLEERRGWIELGLPIDNTAHLRDRLNVIDDLLDNPDRWRGVSSPSMVAARELFETERRELRMLLAWRRRARP